MLKHVKKSKIFFFWPYCLLGAFYHPWLRRKLECGLRAWFWSQEDLTSKVGSALCWRQATDLSTHFICRINEPGYGLYSRCATSLEPQPVHSKCSLILLLSLYILYFLDLELRWGKSFLPKKSTWIIWKQSTNWAWQKIYTYSTSKWILQYLSSL